MTTDPFGTIERALFHPGDYINPETVTPCRCGTLLVIPAPRPSSLPIPGRPAPPAQGFDDCPDHDCCATWSSVVLCRWAYDWVAAGNPNTNPQQRCRNLFVTNEYHPVQRAMGPDPETGERAAPAWSDGVGSPPTFPVDMFYSHRPPPDASDDEVEENAAVREDFFRISRRIWEIKKGVVDRLAVAEDKLGMAMWLRVRDGDQEEEEVVVVEEENYDDDGDQSRKTRPERLAEGLVMAQEALRHLAPVFRQLEIMSKFLTGSAGCQLYVLEFLGKVPGPGASAVSADRSYSVSRERLELDNSNDAIVAAARGSAHWRLAQELWDRAIDMRVALEAELEDEAAAAAAAVDAGKKRKLGLWGSVVAQAHKTAKKRRMMKKSRASSLAVDTQDSSAGE